MITSYLLFFLVFHHRIDFIYSAGDVFLENEELDSKEKEYLKNSPPDHEIPYSEHEDPPEPSTRPKYEAPGQWAKPPADKNIPLDFVPSTMYAQVRGTHTIKRAPKHQALLDASTDEERENAGRLKEVVTNKKVNTIYTEEGYEDAAYDHAGQQRDADFQEDYDNDRNHEDKSHDVARSHASSETEDSSEEDGDNIERSSIVDEKQPKLTKLKNKKYSPKNGIRKVWTGAGVNPITFVKKEGLKLEKYLESEAEKAALGAETEVPENLKYLNNDSGSIGDAIIENSTQQLRRVSIDNSVETPAAKHEYLKTVKKSPFTTVTPPPVARALERYDDDAGKKYPTYHEAKPKVYPTYREMMGTTSHPTNINHGQVYRDYSKPQRSEYVASPKATLNPLEIRPSSAEEYQSSENSGERYPIQKSKESIEYSLESPEMSRETSRPREYPRQKPSQPSKYSTITSPRVIQAILKSPQVMKAMTAPKYSRETSEEVLKPTSGARDLPTPAARPIYTVVIRAPSKPCDERSDESKLEESVSNYELMKHLTTSVDPRLVNAEVMNDISVMKPPPVSPFGQVTYADFLHNAQGQLAKSSETQESSSASEESGQVSLENPQSLPPRYYGPQRNRPQNRMQQFFSWLSGLNPMGKPITPRMLPPSPMSRSRYAEYAVRRNGVQLPQKNSWSNVPYYNPAFQVSGGVPTRFRREATGDNEEFLSTELRTDDNVELLSLRKKRSSEDLLNEAPKVAEAVVDGEIKARFGDKSEAESSSQELGNKEEEKVEIVVPEFDFLQAFEDIDNHEQFNTEIEIKNNTFSAEKYPFYKNDQIPNNSALKYVINPKQVPRKSFGGMEFYTSRDRYLNCEDVNPDLSEVLPAKEEPNPDQEPNENLPRLNGLGDKLSCFKAKYFDKNPLDNPLFMERRIDTPEAPDEFNLQRFKDRMPHLSSEAEALVYRRVSRTPEFNDLHRSDKHNNELVNHSKSKSNHNSAPNHRVKKKRHRQRNPVRMREPMSSPYEKQVYEDVMGTIKNQAGLNSRKSPARPSRRSRKNQSQKKAKPHDIRPEPHRPPLSWKPKGGPYRTDKLPYRMRPRIHSGADSRHPGYYKKVMIYKRSIDSNADLQTAESRDPLGNWTPIKVSRDKKSGVTSPVTTKPPFDTSGHSTPKSVWTAKDRTRSSKPRGTARYGKFKSEVASVEPRRKEPRYENPTPQPDANYSAPDSEREFRASESDDASAEEETEATAAPYEVHEAVVEKLTEPPEVSKLRDYLNSDFPGYNKEPENSKESAEEAESAEVPTTRYAAEKDDSAEEESGEEEEPEESQVEQLEKPSESSTEESSERVEPDEDSSPESQSNQKVSEGKASDEEEDFERYSDRPDSPAEDNYDPEYADLGPRINKPAFHHPRFEPPRYEHHRGKDYESLEEEEPKKKRSKYVFPWDEDEKEASAESKVAEDTLAKYEYPWERRARLARENEQNEKKEKPKKIKDSKHYHRYWNEEDGDQRSSETGFNFEIIHPFKQWRSPFKNDDFRRWSSGMSDDYEVEPKKFSSKYHKRSESPVAKDGITRAIENFMENNVNTPTTTITPQIPPTSITSIPRNQPTTPMIKTLRPRPFRVTPWNSITPPTLQPNTFIIRRKIQSSTPSSSTPKSHHQSHPRTTTRSSSTTAGIPPRMHLRHSNHRQHPVFKPESTTSPSKRTVAHRSRVSTEEIITKTSESNPLKDKSFSSTKDDGPRKNERVQKVSIVTKETPDHIYRTKKVDKNGVKRKFITITPNDRIDRLEMDDDTSLSDMSMEDMTGDMDSDIQERMDDPHISEDARIPEEHFLASPLMRVPPE